METATLIIEKQAVQKQNQQLQSYMESQQNAIIMFKLKDSRGTELCADPTAATPKVDDVGELHVSFQNQAVKGMLALELPDVTAVDAVTTRPQHERKFFATKNFDEDENVTPSQTAANLKTIVDVLTQNFHNSRAVSMVMKNAEGATRYLELQMNSISLNKEEYRVATFHEMTESKRLARSEANTRMVQLLSSSVTHEMVTPLKCIISFANSLQKELKHSPKCKEAELIYVTAKLLLSEVKLLLDQNMIQNEIFTLQFEHVPFNRIISDAVQIMSHQAGQKNIQIDYTPLPRELIVKIDPLRVQQVLINLLQNAIKFTPEGKKITVYTQLSIEQRTSDKYKLQVLVKDEGIGMSKDDQKRLFKPFFKSSSAENRAMNTGGHGLGLSICKLLAEKL